MFFPQRRCAPESWGISAICPYLGGTPQNIFPQSCREFPVGQASRLPSNDLPAQARRPRYIPEVQKRLDFGISGARSTFMLMWLVVKVSVAFPFLSRALHDQNIGLQI
jgi:hypothetical protein